MSSNINPNNINGNFPVAGQDNDSQGFRDNFTNILNNFSFAASEISDLQNQVTALETYYSTTGNITASTANITTITGNLIGDIYTVNGQRVLDNGTNFQTPTFIGDIVAGDGTTKILDNGTGATDSNLTVANANVTVNMNFGGGQTFQNGYQYNIPVNNFTLAGWSNVARIILDPAGALVNGNIGMPSGNVDAKVVHISSTQTITNFTVNGNAGTTVTPAATYTLTGGTGVSYFYHASEGKWYKIG